MENLDELNDYLILFIILCNSKTRYIFYFYFVIAKMKNLISIKK